MDVRSRRSTATAKAGPTVLKAKKLIDDESDRKASDALPMPLYFTNVTFFTLFFSVVYFLLTRWREKIRTSTPLHVLTFSEISAIFALVASFIYLLGFFGIDFVQSLILRPSADVWADDEEEILKDDSRKVPCGAALDCQLQNIPPPKVVDPVPVTVLESIPVPVPVPVPVPSLEMTEEDEEIVKSVVEGTTPSYSLESKLGDCRRAAAIRREALQRTTGKSLAGLPLEGFDYEAILGQCCEMPVGYVQIPVGIAGPLLLDEKQYSVPMATTEGCLVASTNRGCKAIHLSGGATSVLMRDGMTRAPVVRFNSAKRAAELKFFVEEPANFDTLAMVFNR